MARLLDKSTKVADTPSRNNVRCGDMTIVSTAAIHEIQSDVVNKTRHILVIGSYLSGNRAFMMRGCGVRLLAAMSEPVTIQFHFITLMCLGHAIITSSTSTRWNC